MKEPNEAQIKQLECTISGAAADLEYVTEFPVAELKGAAGVEEFVFRRRRNVACGWRCGTRHSVLG
jgi:hypothetical protein